MNGPALRVWLLAYLARLCRSQNPDNQTAVPVWSLGSGSKFGTANICNGTFADFNATGLFNFSSDAVLTSQAGSNDLTAGMGIALTVQSAPDTTSDPTNATSSAWTIWWNANGANYSDKFSLGYDLCTMVGTLNYNTQLRGQSDNGTCSSALNGACVSDVQEVAVQYADWLTTPDTLGPDSNLTSTTLPSLCSTLAGKVRDNLPASCSPFFQAPGIIVPGFALTSYGSNYDTVLSPACTANVTWQSAVSIYSNNSLAVYDAWTQVVVPAITVFLPIADSARVNQASSALITTSVAEVNCVHIDHINEGSYDPPSLPDPTPIDQSNNISPANSTASTPAQASSARPQSPGGGLSGGAIAGIVTGVVAALALFGAGFFLWLRRKKSSATQASPRHVQTAQVFENRAELTAHQEQRHELGGAGVCGKFSEPVRRASELEAHNNARHEAP